MVSEMNTTDIATLIVAALGAGGFGALLTYLIARRRTSGAVATSDADRLWLQYDKLLDGYARDNNSLRDRLTHTENRLYEKINVVQGRVQVVETKVDGVHDSLKTGNGLTVGQMLSDNETRRVMDKKSDAKPLTTEETQHLQDVPPKAPANGGSL